MSVEQTGCPVTGDGGMPDFPLGREGGVEPPAGYAELRAERPVAPVRLADGQVVWLVTRYADARDLLTDSRVSADRAHPGFPMLEPVTPQSRRNIAAVARSLVGLDPPEHGPHRRMLIPEFTFHRVRELRPHIEQVVEACVDDLMAAGPPADLVAHVAMPVPLMVLCELLGVPYADREFFTARTAQMVGQATEPAQRQKAAGELRGYLDELITSKETTPADDLLGRLITHNRTTGVFDHGLLVSLGMFLLVAGGETTTGMISLGIADLLTHPDQLAHLTADPDSVEAAVEELLRHASVVDAMARVATADIEVGGTTIPAGDGIIISFAAANWDPGAFTDPGTLSIQNATRKHISFGYGVHQCIGQNLARQILRTTYHTLLTRLPTLSLTTPLHQLPFKKDTNVYGIERLPVTW